MCVSTKAVFLCVEVMSVVHSVITKNLKNFTAKLLHSWAILLSFVRSGLLVIFLILNAFAAPAHPMWNEAWSMKQMVPCIMMTHYICCLSCVSSYVQDEQTSTEALFRWYLQLVEIVGGNGSASASLPQASMLWVIIMIWVAGGLYRTVHGLPWRPMLSSSRPAVIVYCRHWMLWICQKVICGTWGVETAGAQVEDLCAMKTTGWWSSTTSQW